jgi:hypothetical protein
MRESYFYMGDVQGPEKVNDPCVKTLHAGTMDRGYIVFMKSTLVFDDYAAVTWCLPIPELVDKSIILP